MQRLGRRHDAHFEVPVQSDFVESQLPADAADRLQQLETLTDTALARLGLKEQLVELLDRTSEVFRVDTAAVLLLDRALDELVPAAARGLDAESRQAVRVPIGQGFAGAVAASGRPMILDEVDGTNLANPALLDDGIRSLLGVPLMATGELIGVLHVGSRQPRRFTDDDTQMLQRVGDRIALTVQSGRAVAEHSAARLLASSLMPGRLPRLPGLDLAARYVPNDDRGVGGDWYDVLDLPDGRVGLVIGDVTGHGLRSAIIMGRLRSALRAYALIEDDPAVVLQYLDRKLQHFEPGHMATVCYGTLNPERDSLRISLAGHFPPMVAVADEPAVSPDLPVDPPLGVRDGIRRHSTDLPIPPGATLCLFTDGLIERRGSDIDTDLDRLRAKLFAGPPDHTCADLLRAMVDTREVDDDVALLVLRRKPMVS
jgi:GAF domain-containing protein